MSCLPSAESETPGSGAQQSAWGAVLQATLVVSVPSLWASSTAPSPLCRGRRGPCSAGQRRIPEEGRCLQPAQPQGAAQGRPRGFQEVSCSFYIINNTKQPLTQMQRNKECTASPSHKWKVFPRAAGSGSHHWLSLVLKTSNPL